jgi:hypothetical protein
MSQVINLSSDEAFRKDPILNSSVKKHQVQKHFSLSVYHFFSEGVNKMKAQTSIPGKKAPNIFQEIA